MESLPPPAEPSPTELAWEARAHLLQYRSSDPETPQAQHALEQAQAGFTRLWQLTHTRLETSALQRTGNDVRAVEDIIQDTYSRAWKHLHKFRGDAQIETWLHRIMFNRLSDYYKKAAKLVPTKDEELVRSESIASITAIGSSMSPFTTVDARDFILSIMQKPNISPRMRAVLLLHHAFGWPHKEIGEQGNISEANAKIIASRGLKAVRDNLPPAEDA